MPDAAEPGSLFNTESHRGSPRPALLDVWRTDYIRAHLLDVLRLYNVSAHHFPFHVQLIDMT
jgi:hypothetical protein